MILPPGLTTPPMVFTYRRCTTPFTGERRVVRLTRSCNAVCASRMRPISALTSFTPSLRTVLKIEQFLLLAGARLLDGRLDARNRQAHRFEFALDFGLALLQLQELDFADDAAILQRFP